MRFGKSWERLGMKYNTYIMENVLEAIIDYRGKTPKKSETGIPTLSAKTVRNNYIDYNKVKSTIRERLSNFLSVQTGNKPMIITVIQEI